MNILSSWKNKVVAEYNKGMEEGQAISRVKTKKKQFEMGTSKEQIDDEAKKVSEKYGVSYEDAVVFTRSERKKKVSTERTKKIVGGIVKQWGQARENLHKTGNLTGISPLRSQPQFRPISLGNPLKRPLVNPKRKSRPKTIPNIRI